MFGSKSDGYPSRLAEAHRLTELMQSKRPFCFLRLGDMELAYLMACQTNQLHRVTYNDGSICGTQGYGNPGLGPKYADRLWQAYEQADYLDYHERNWPIEYVAPQLKLKRRADATRNPGKDTSVIFLTWVEKEFKRYCQGRRVGIAGAESRLLEILSQSDTFKKAAADYWPEQADIYFHQARDDGRNLDANLHLVKEDLIQFVKIHELDTLFLSLGGGAKVLGYELSRELGICCFDFGAMTRALTYSGCDGNRVTRSPHSPFLFRIPFGTYMEALEQAMPNLTPAELLAKAHGQLVLEVMKKEVGWTFVSWEFDFSKENRAAFKRGYQVYRTRYQPLFKASPEAQKERAGFLHFCGTHRLTWGGQFFFARFRAKCTAARMIKKMQSLMGLKQFIDKVKARLRRHCRQIIQHFGIFPMPPLCENIVLWAQDRGYKTRRIHGPFILDFPLPDCVLAYPRLKALFQVVNGLGYSSQHLATLPNATIKGHRALIVLEHNWHLVEGHWRAFNVFEHPFYRNEWPVTRKRELHGDWYCLMGHWGENYNHWLWDELPRLFSALPSLPANIRFLVSDDMPEVQCDSLQALGITPERCLSQSSNECSKVERLWFASPLGHSEHASTAPDIVIKMANMIVGHYGSQTKRRMRRIFITRSKAKYRRLLNESDLVSELVRLGFEIVRPEELKFADQVRLFSECAIVLAQHGAGLTNMLFAPTGCRVLEIHGPEVTRFHYWMMACTMGHRYDCFVGKATGIPQDSSESGEPDFSVDMARFIPWLNASLLANDSKIDA
jgi:capsular polysaccharide biosynthesis protein